MRPGAKNHKAARRDGLVRFGVCAAISFAVTTNLVPWHGKVTPRVSVDNPLSRDAVRSVLESFSQCPEAQRCLNARSSWISALPLRPLEVEPWALPEAWEAAAAARTEGPFETSVVTARRGSRREPECAAELDAVGFEAQFERAIADAVATSRGDEVVYTILDASYADMLDDVYAGMERMGASDRLVFVALHRGTAMQACLAGYRVALLSPPSPTTTTTKDMVYLGKYYTALLLCAARIRFWFFEMDLWLLPRNDPEHSILGVFRRASEATNGGERPRSAWALHEDNPYTINAGMYYIGKDDQHKQSRKLFAGMLSYLRRRPNSFDQGLLNCLLKRISEARALAFIRERDNCEEHLVKLDDAVLSRFIAEALGVGGYNFTVVDPAVALSYASPFVTRDTLAVHVLSSRPLSSAAGKKKVAKELMLWEGTGCYYCLGNTIKWVALEEGLFSPSGADDVRAIFRRLNEIIAFAWATRRGLILPQVTHLGRRSPAWEFIDTSSLDEIGIPWREGTFLKNPRLKLAKHVRLARLSAYGDSNYGVSSIGGPTEWYKTAPSESAGDRVLSLVAVALNDEVASTADLLFVSLDPDRGRVTSLPPYPQKPAFARPTHHHQPVNEPPDWLSRLRWRLRWCPYQHRETRRIHLAAAHLDCQATVEGAASLKAKRATMKAEAVVERPDSDDHLDAPTNTMLTYMGRERLADAFADRLRSRVDNMSTERRPDKTRFHGIVPSDFYPINLGLV